MPPKKKKAGKKGRIDRGGANLGRAMIKTQFPSAAMSTSQAVLETERGKHKLRSVTQCDDLEDLMANAMLAGTDFLVEFFGKTLRVVVIAIFVLQITVTICVSHHIAFNGWFWDRYFGSIPACDGKKSQQHPFHFSSWVDHS